MGWVPLRGVSALVGWEDAAMSYIEVPGWVVIVLEMEEVSTLLGYMGEIWR
jgi:hypothetical protein